MSKYTEEIAKSFHAIKAPQDFAVTLIEFESYITIEVNPYDLVDISDERAIEIVDYINAVKKMLESFGIIVNVSREAIENDDESN
jgi:hypothetical protein